MKRCRGRLAVLHQKGGTGKTTLSIALALAHAQAGSRVLLLDTDYQGTAMSWGERWAEPLSAALDGELLVRSQMQADIPATLDRFQDQFDLMVVDAPPTLSEMSASILKAVDRVFIPLRPSFPDIWALETVQGLLALETQLGEAQSVQVVFNQVEDEDLGIYREALSRFDMSVAKTALKMDGDFRGLFQGRMPKQGVLDQVLSLCDEH